MSITEVRPEKGNFGKALTYNGQFDQLIVPRERFYKGVAMNDDNEHNVSSAFASVTVWPKEETIEQKRELLFLDVPIDSFDLSTENLGRRCHQAATRFLSMRFAQ